jgi:hypothetical protein
VIVYNRLSGVVANLVTTYETPTSFLVLLPGNGSYFDSEPSSSVHHPIYPIDSNPTVFDFSAPKGDLFEPPSSSYPIKTHGYELRPALIALVRENSFSGTKEESPYIHLRGFEKICLIIIIEGMTQQTLKGKLFPFSLTGGAKKWYSSSVGSIEGSWEKVREKFCLTFFPRSRVVALRQC